MSEKALESGRTAPTAAACRAMAAQLGAAPKDVRAYCKGWMERNAAVGFVTDDADVLFVEPGWDRGGFLVD